MELLLKIFRTCLPSMPKTASAFAEALEKSMTPLVSKPTFAPASQVCMAPIGHLLCTG